MPKNESIKRILVIGSGPIVIGQAAEFDYAGTQACQALREEGYQVVLVNSNPATIMTDAEVADKVYIEPLTVEFVSQIIHKERPDAILGSLGGQTGLNLVVELSQMGILSKYGVKILGTALEAIEKAEDRQKFRDLMNELGEPVPESVIVSTILAATDFADQIGYPVIVRPAFTLGGTGGGIADCKEKLEDIVEGGLKLSPMNQCLIEQSIAGYKEIEYEVMRDANDNAIVVCNMENIDPVGIHTGDSAVVAPTQTLSDRDHQMLRNASLKIIRALKIEGGCNVQLALDTESFQYYVIEVNPRVSRSSALASKATGYPIARIAAKIAVGLTLDEIVNPVTKTSYACFEPTLDYIVAKLPRFPFDKFASADRRLGTQMKATGEVMAIGRTFEEAFLKAIRSLEMKTDHVEHKEIKNYSMEALWEKVDQGDDERLYAIAQLIRNGIPCETINERTKIDMFFLKKIEKIVVVEEQLKAKKGDLDILKKAKSLGFSDSYIGRVWGMDEYEMYQMRKEKGIIPVYKMVDTCAAEFESNTPYFYSTYATENESIRSDRKKCIVLGSGPIRIGQGVEFDYATVHCVKAIREAGYEAIVINNNPETVSTDFSISDKLYFEPLALEDVMHIVDLENPFGVVVQFGGQTAINLAPKLEKMGVKIIGTSLDNIDRAEARDRFEATLRELQIPQPLGKTATDGDGAVKIAQEIGYPVLVRPSYVLGGRAMEIVHNEEDLRRYMEVAVKEVSNDQPILIDRYLIGKEVEVDAVGDGKQIFIPGIMEHIERAGVHSGDSISVYPAQTISEEVKEKIKEYTEKIGKGFHFIGLYNIQFIVTKDQNVYVLEVNPRSSRTVPFLSKITGVPMAKVATRAILGVSLAEQGYKTLYKEEPNLVFVKTPVFSFAKLRSVDTTLGPEMKSTGEALGMDKTLEKALYKGLIASGINISLQGSVLFTIADNNKEEALPLAKRFNDIGYGIYATKGTADFLKSRGITYVKEVARIGSDEDFTVLDVIRKGFVSYVVNTMSTKKEVAADGFLIRRIAVENGIPCFTSLDTTAAILKVIETRSFSYMAMDEVSGVQNENECRM